MWMILKCPKRNQNTRISRSSRPASSMSSWRKSSSMRPATRRARIGRRRSTFTTRASEPWNCQKSRHQWKNEKTVQPKLYRSLFPHDVFLSGAAFLLLLFRRTGILLKFAQNRLEIPLCDKDATLPRRSLHIGSQVQTRGVSALCEVDRGMIRQAGGNGCARLQRASASSGVAAPQGCGTFSLITAWSFLHRY